MLASEIFFRQIPSRRALAHYGGLTGSPDESGEKGLARAGNMRVRNGLIQLALFSVTVDGYSDIAQRH